MSRRRGAFAEKALVEDQLADAHRQLQSLFERGIVGLALLAATGIGYGLLKSRQSRRRELELLRQRIAGDLHDDIGSNFGNVALLSEIAAEHGTEATREDL